MKCILVVDANRQTFDRIREHVGTYILNVRFIHACSANDGLNQYIIHGPHLIITEIEFNGQIDTSLITEIRRHNPSLPIVVYTNLIEVKSDVISAGANTHVGKSKLNNLNKAVYALL